MDENQKAKMEAMKKQIQRKKQEQELLNNSLYQECLTALKDYVIVQDETDIRYLTSLVSSNDIESHSHSEEVKLADTERYYIVWDNMSVPILESSGKCINDSWDDVRAASFDTYFVVKSTEIVIGIRH